MRTSFDQAFEWVVGHEGGFGADSRDRGNWTGGAVGKGTLKGTKFGISAAAYPNLDIKNLTVADAKSIYLTDYWEKAHCDTLPVGIDYITFDIAVNHGVGKAARILQIAAGTTVDGQIGPKTLSAVKSRDVYRMIEDMATDRQMSYVSYDTWRHYGKGWTRRNMGTVVRAMLLLDQSKAGGLWRRV